MEWGRVADYQAFVDGVDQLAEEVIVLNDRHLVDERLLLHILVLFVGSGYSLTLIGQDSHAGLHRLVVEQRDELLVQFLLEEHGTVGAVDDFPAIEGEDESTVFFQFQFFCQGHDAVSRSARCQYHVYVFRLCLHECLLCAGCDLFPAVCQCAVQVQHDHLVFHISFL